MKPNVKPNAPYRELAERIYALRMAKGLSREQLGEQCGCTGRTIGNYEHGIRKPTSNVAPPLAAALGVTVEELLGTSSAFATRSELKKADSVEMFRQMYGTSTAQRMEAIIDATDALNAEGVLTRDEIEDFADELNKVLIRMRETAREKFTPRSRRTEAQKRSIAEGRAMADAIDDRIREEQREKQGTRDFNAFLLGDDDEGSDEA